MTASERDYYVRGVVPILTAAALWAVGYLIRKTILLNVSPFALCFWTSTLAAGMIYVQHRVRLRDAWSAFKRHRTSFLALSTTGVILGTTLMYVALQHIGLAEATLLEKLQPLVTLALAVAFLHEKVSVRTTVFAALALVASYAIATGNLEMAQLSRAQRVGSVAVVGAAASWGIAAVIGKALMRDATPEIVAFIRFSIASVVMLPVAAWRGDLVVTRISIEVGAMIVVAAYVSTVLGYMLYYRGLRYVGAGTSGFLELVTPVVATVLGVVVLGEHLTSIQLWGIPLLLGSVYMVTAGAEARA